ncbi:Fic family protein [archaeon]|nr:Fic family protein [Nanoarchaeota archaeon]MCG2723197.1 Fic family protein [archaeon]
MAAIRKKKVGAEEYYYLAHSFREGGKIVKKEKYLGKVLPKNIDEIKRIFLSEIYKEKWFSQFDKIKQSFSKDRKATPPSALEKEIKTFAIRFTYDTNKIEGSTLTLRETADLLGRGITPSEKPLRDVKEAEAHMKAFYEMREYKKDISLQMVLYFHKKLFEGTKPDIAGKIRQHQVAIAGSKFMPPFPAEVYPLLSDFFRGYNKNKSSLHPVELAAGVHIKLVTIHPFADGNGRISRLMMNFVLNKNGFPMLNIPYEKRGGYYTALERAQVKKDESIFLHWFFKKYLNECKRYVRNKEIA